MPRLGKPKYIHLSISTGFADMRNTALLLLASDQAIVLRTDYSSDDSWSAVKAATAAPVGDFQANLVFVEDPSFDGLGPAELVQVLEGKSARSFIFLADQITMRGSEHQLICLDLSDQPGKTFRLVASQTWSVENNLSLGNMDFRDFATSLDGSGIFRGFKE